MACVLMKCPAESDMAFHRDFLFRFRGLVIITSRMNYSLQLIMIVERVHVHYNWMIHAYVM